MILSESAWYSKAYFFIEDWWAYFIGKDYRADKSYHRNTNLCQFMRTFILKLPILLFAQTILYFSIFFALFWFPFSFLGLSLYAISLLVIAGIIGVVVGAYYGKEKLSPFFSTQKVEESTDPSFFSLIITWLVARKKAICPLISIKNREDDK